MKTHKVRNSLLLLLTALIWGTAFVAQSVGKCKQETLINAKNLHIVVIKEPDALDAEPMNL